jgi:uncharacterized protein
MPLFVLTCIDNRDSLELRLSTRQAHLDYLAAFTNAVKLAGPLLDGADGAPNGSMLILEMPSLNDVEAFAANDPYAKAGLFARSSIKAFRATIGSL